MADFAGALTSRLGLQVDAEHIAKLIEISPEDAAESAAIGVVRAAWLASFDLDSLGLWLSNSVDEESKARVDRLQGASAGD